MPESDSRRLEDRIKVVFFGLVVTVIFPMMGYLWGQLQGVNVALTEYKLLVVEKYATKQDLRDAMSVVISHLDELKADLKTHQQEARTGFRDRSSSK